MHPMQCACGSMAGEIEGRGLHNHVVCYCTDCRAFARFLGRADSVLDDQGGTELVQLAQPRLRFTRGERHLSIIRLSEKGILRWYAGCCRTPIGNTLASPRVSVIGLVHACLDRARLDRDFGGAAARVHTGSALGMPGPRPRGMPGVIARLLAIVLWNGLGGRYRQSPLFDENGLPRAEAAVLSPDCLAALKAGAGTP